MTKRTPARLLERLHPGKLLQAVDGIRLIGWRKSWQVVRSTVAHAYWDRRYAPRPPDWSAPGVTPGRLLAKESTAEGITARFEHADLEVRMLGADVARVTWHPDGAHLRHARERRALPRRR